MQTKISLTASETPLTETYMTLRYTSHGNKIYIQSEKLKAGQENP
jgi:hypothetical protein